MNHPSMQPRVSCDNVIIVDADYADRVAFDLTVNFERMIGRKIPPADLAHWLDCIALDGGLREGSSQTQVALIHRRGSERMEYFSPGHYASELDGKAFSDRLGEFAINAYTDEDIAGKQDLMADMLRLCCSAGEVKRIMVVPDEADYDLVRQVLRQADDDGKRVTVFAMQPMPGGPFRQEILGYSLMSALGIRADEIG